LLPQYFSIYVLESKTRRLFRDRHIPPTGPWRIYIPQLGILIVARFPRHALSNSRHLLLDRGPSNHEHRDDESQEVHDSLDDGDIPCAFLVNVRNDSMLISGVELPA
jgi:hypothetical protein